MTELAMLLRIHRILAMASRCTADVVLLADAPRLHRSQFGKLAFDFSNSALDIGMWPADSFIDLSTSVNKK